MVGDHREAADPARERHQELPSWNRLVELIRGTRPRAIEWRSSLVAIEAGCRLVASSSMELDEISLPEFHV
jgi:hypothetical protein